MSDTREQIIERLVELMGNITGIVGVYRDRAGAPKDLLPCAIVLDGSENLVYPVTDRKTVKMPMAIMALRPQIFIELLSRDNATNETLGGIAAPIGPEISAYRDQVLAAVINDSVLTQLVTPNGQITYEGCDTDMQTGSAIRGELQMHFEFHYVFIPPSG